MTKKKSFGTANTYKFREKRVRSLNCEVFGLWRVKKSKKRMFI